MDMPGEADAMEMPAEEDAAGAPVEPDAGGWAVEPDASEGEIGGEERFDGISAEDEGDDSAQEEHGGNDGDPAAAREAVRRTPQERLPAQVAGRSKAEAQMRANLRGLSRNGKARGQRSKKPLAASGLRASAAGADQPKRSGTRSRRTTVARAGAVGSLAVVGVLVWLLVSIFQPFHGPGHGRVIVVIPKDTGAGGVGSILAKRGVVSSGFFFDVRTLIDGKRSDLHAGRYVLKHDMSYSEAIAALSGQVPDVAVTKVMIPEGETRSGIAQIVKKDGLKGDYMRASRRVPGFNPTVYGARKGTPSLEGFLFPATYEVGVHANVSTLISEQLEAFHERLTGEFVMAARKLGITPYELLIVASMIEREAKLPKDRPDIAAVIYNRLRLGMPLGIDATIRYALNDWTGPLSESQLHVNSPYNTRLHKGLPPTPISNPGIESLEAAAHPAKVGYLYYVNGADGCGDLVFSDSYAEFEHDTALYEEALASNGGKEPTCKQK